MRMVHAMTTLKPQLVRADTLDLQDHNSPSAKDHTRQPTHPSPYGYGPAAPHQAQTLRHAEEEAYQQQRTSPGVSEDHNRGGPFSDSQRFYDDTDEDVDDEHMNHLHGANGDNANGRDYEEDGDASDSHDEDMDDDLMDKISSSPSIEDGKYSLPRWPPRTASVDPRASPALDPMPTRGISFSSSPFTSPPVHFPFPQKEMAHCSNRRLGEEDIVKHPVEMSSPLTIRPLYTAPYKTTRGSSSDPALQPYDMSDSMDSEEIVKYLLPIDDPLLDDSFDDHQDEGFYDDEDAWVDEDVNMPVYEPSSEDDTGVISTGDSRFIDSGWGGECLRELEDIDFEFVYALHTFVATVEGQANATKGDTMVLLDDSNSYWWLVRVVKDGSIGYLPAEHIETPTERLARLNKHRNIDLSASMLGDNPEKSKNPLKKAMRRRNAKSVQFTAPTYYEPSVYEYSDDEEMDESQIDQDDNVAKAQQTDQTQQQQNEDNTTIAHEAQGVAATNGIIQRVASSESLSEEPSSPVKVQAPEPLQPGVSHQDSVSRSRKGNVRNTDSFFKDDSVETKKISLTPRLLRGDSDSNGSGEQELRQRPSLETFDKMLSQDEKPKEDKKKEKKGMLSGLFKRKEKAPKGSKTEPDAAVKVSEESVRHSPQSKDSLESLTKPESGPERKPSKLQKHPPSYTSPKNSPTEPRAPQPLFSGSGQSAAPPAPTGPAPAPPTLRQVEPIDTSVAREEQRALQPTNKQSQAQTPNRFPSLQEKRSIFSPISATLKSSTVSAPTDSNAETKPDHSNHEKERFAVDTSDSDGDPTPTGGSNAEDNRGVSPLTENQYGHRRNDSGMQISPVEPTANDSIEGAIPAHNETGVDARLTPEASKTSAAPQALEVTPIEESEHTASTSKPSPSTVTTHTPSTSRSTPTWSDASLRTYMENNQDIKDLLIIVHDKSNVTPVGADHPLMTNLFSTERTKLAEMQSQLDSMLMNWMSRKNASLLSR